jgi:hypothetical protein
MEENGVWRTVGGRRIFIKEGEDLSTAMKKSGKFKDGKKEDKKNEEPKHFHEGRKDIEEEFEQIYAEEGLEYGLRDSNVKYLSEKYDIPKTQVKAYMQDVAKQFDEKNRKATIKLRTNAIEEASGLKVEKSFETDLYGNGKEDRFELSNGTMIAHTTESMGQKVDRWSTFTIENGSIKSSDFKSYEEMIKHLKGSK